MTQIPQKIIHRFAPIATPESTEASQKTQKLTLRLCSLCAFGVTLL